MKRNILVVVAHADDEAIGCGGTLVKHQQQGDTISIIYMTDGVSSRHGDTTAASNRQKMAKQVGEYLNAKQYQFNFPDNQMDQIPILAVTQTIESVIQDTAPDIVYTHHCADLNIDHRIVHQAVMTAFRPIPGKKVPTIYNFEVNSSTEWNTPNSTNSFLPNFFIDISAQINNKVTLLEFYQEEMPPFPHTRSIESITALATVRGCSIGVNCAEAFMLMRELK